MDDCAIVAYCPGCALRMRKSGQRDGSERASQNLYGDSNGPLLRETDNKVATF